LARFLPLNFGGLFTAQFWRAFHRSILAGFYCTILAGFLSLNFGTLFIAQFWRAFCGVTFANTQP
jgi:hypothetical protein